jgi:hypothetical protein
MEPRARRAVDKVRPGGVKLKKRPTSAVTAKLNPMENVNRSISSKPFFLGNRVSVKQYPGRKTARRKPNA